MEDITMTGEAGAYRTFRSIFGNNSQQHVEKPQLEQKQSDDGANSKLILAIDDEDEAMWSDEQPLDTNTTEIEPKELFGLQFAQRKSMEEWADDDDEEENWKDALQDRVNQLEIVNQHGTDATEAKSSHQVDQQKEAAGSDLPCFDCSQSLPVSPRLIRSRDLVERRPASRHKMQRTSSLNACINGDNAISSSSQDFMWSFQRRLTREGKVQASRQQSHSFDFITRNIETIEHHRKGFDSIRGASSKTRHLISRPNIMDTRRGSPKYKCCCSRHKIKKEALIETTSSDSTGLSETESIRRFVLDEIKNMSMERLVSDAQRLASLEEFYRNHQISSSTPSINISTALLSPASQMPES